MKGKANVFTNIKPMAGGAAIMGLQPGDWAFGDLSTTGSDLINFDHFYRANGARVELDQMCKATAANLTITNESEGTTPPPDPTPDPTPDPIVLTHIIEVFSDGSIEVDGNPYP